MTAIKWHWKLGANLPDSQESVRLSMWVITISQLQSRTSKPNDALPSKTFFLTFVFRNHKICGVLHQMCSTTHDNEWNNVICSNTDAPRDNPTKWSKSKTSNKLYHIPVGSKKWYRWAYLQNRKKIHRHRKQTYGHQRWKRGGIN